MLDELLGRLRIWVVVTSNENKEKVRQALGTTSYTVEAFSVADVSSELENLSNTVAEQGVAAGRQRRRLIEALGGRKRGRQ